MDPCFSMNLNLPYPEKNRIEAKRNDQRMNDNAPFDTTPKWVFVIERKKNID